MTTPLLIRYYHPEMGIQLGLVREGMVYTLEDIELAAWLESTTGHVQEAIAGLLQFVQGQEGAFPVSALDNLPDSGSFHWLPPLDYQEVWAAGVTYLISRDARQEEAEDGGDVYARVYDAERPELFLKATEKNTVGPFDEVGIREDATWNVPEPELGIVLNPAMEVVGFTIGNDMSSRDIEGANPLYLPQAKVYTASCALGPGILLAPAETWPDLTIQITIERAEKIVFAGDVHTSRIKRTMSELIEYLGKSNTFPDGVILLTGTGTVPPADFTLAPGDVVTITIEGIGTLQNTVKVV